MDVIENQPIGYGHKFQKIKAQTLFRFLPEKEQKFAYDKAFEYAFTAQELRIFCEYSLERLRFKEPLLADIWHLFDKTKDKKLLFRELEMRQKDLLSTQKSYRNFKSEDKPVIQKPLLKTHEKSNLGLGRCPVASEKTRCCNLLTLDAVEKCGFDCSYCSIQSFYHGNEVSFDGSFADKLLKLKLDPDKTYHIGTGQSSDSLMWGNHEGILEALAQFARENPNVILELKTKSKNISWLLKNDVPANIICTWSLNPQTIIDHEEHLSASLQQRIDSARRLADKGCVVGFHFHPIVWYDDWRQDYADICQLLTQQFSSKEVAMISMGTLTFTKSVMKTIRKRDFYSKILQMPMQEIAGKYSYPLELKLDLFTHVYQQLSEWHNKTFFYLCMEAHSLWQPVFGYQYDNNEDFEAAMKSSYFDKIRMAESGRLDG